MLKVSTEEQFRTVIESEQLTIAVFKANWCVDCHFIDPFMPELIEQYAGRAAFIEADRDELPDLCAELNILGIPSFIAFSSGKELVRFVSKLRKDRSEIEQFVDRAISVYTVLKS